MVTATLHTVTAATAAPLSVVGRAALLMGAAAGRLYDAIWALVQRTMKVFELGVTLYKRADPFIHPQAHVAPWGWGRGPKPCVLALRQAVPKRKFSSMLDLNCGRSSQRWLRQGA